jgi:protein-L-isoaspartate(D-aspartate) O-methyltransferase
MDNDQLVDKMISEGNLSTPVVINAFRKVDRINFIPEKQRDNAYGDFPLPIGEGQTISQPTTVAIMTERLDPKPGMKILEIGAGSGYQSAILSRIVGQKGKVFTIERIEFLYEMAKRNLKNYRNITVVLGDGSIGLESSAPFDRVIVTACAPEVPKPLYDQLKTNGKMVLPVGKSFFWQKLLLVERSKLGMKTSDIGPFVFVPLIGELGFEG